MWRGAAGFPGWTGGLPALRASTVNSAHLLIMTPVFSRPGPLAVTWNKYYKNEPCHEKTYLRGFRPGNTQTGVLSFVASLEILNYRGNKHPFVRSFYRNDHFCGFYRCVNSGESLKNWVKTKRLYVKFVSDLFNLICGFTSQSTTMVMSRRSVNLTTPFLRRLPKGLNSTKCTSFRQ